MHGAATELAAFDPEIYRAIEDERQRQEDHLDLIASENHASRMILEAQGSVLTNKYAEGYAGRRYYGGCEHVDVVERLAIDRAKALFGAAWANVQPHSGSQANAAVYLALLQPGDTMLSLSLSAGGHLTHGSAVNFSGKTYRAVQYGVDERTGLIDYDEVGRLAREHKPRLIVAGFSAYSRVIEWEIFRAVAEETGALLLADMAHVAGLVACGLYPNPVPHADVVTSTTHKTLCGPRGGIILARRNPELQKKLNSAVFPGTQGGPLMHVIAAKAVCFREATTAAFHVYQQRVLDNAAVLAKTLVGRGYHVVSGGTDNHLFLVDLTARDITGKAAEQALGQAHITVNKNSVPGDKRSPFITSGLRMGTPSISRRGLGTQEVRRLGNWICDLLDDIENEELIGSIRERVRVLCRQFPVHRFTDTLPGSGNASLAEDSGRTIEGIAAD